MARPDYFRIADYSSEEALMAASSALFGNH
jgi:hypothetical protein